jgi:hypothetical protein
MKQRHNSGNAGEAPLKYVSRWQAIAATKILLSRHIFLPDYFTRENYLSEESCDIWPPSTINPKGYAVCDLVSMPASAAPTSCPWSTFIRVESSSAAHGRPTSKHWNLTAL